MKSFRSIGLFLLIAMALLLGTHPVSAQVFNRVVAIVDDDVITLYELNKRIKEMTGSTAEALRDRDEDRYLQTRRKILDIMIDQKCAERKIEELGIKVSPEQVDQAIETVKKRNRWTHENLLAMLKREGITYEEFRDNIETELQRNELINSQVRSKIIIREEQILQYYNENQKDFGSQEKVQLAGIFLIRKNPKDEDEFRGLKAKGKAILARLKNGEDFTGLVKKFSQGPGADEGGNLGTFKTDQLDPELRKALGGIEEGQVTDLVIKESGIQIIKLVKRERAQARPLEEVRETIQATLYQQEVNKRYVTWIKELRKETYTKIIF